MLGNSKTVELASEKKYFMVKESIQLLIVGKEEIQYVQLGCHKVHYDFVVDVIRSLVMTTGFSLKIIYQVKKERSLKKGRAFSYALL